MSDSENKSVAYWYAGKPAYASRKWISFTTKTSAIEAMFHHAHRTADAIESMRGLREILPDCQKGNETSMVLREHFAAMLSAADHYRAARRAAKLIGGAEVHLRGYRVVVTCDPHDEWIGGTHVY
jgi:hypothetical protein